MELPIVSCPAEFRAVADEFKDILGNHYKAFVAVLCGYLLGISNNSDMARFLFFSPSVSTIGRMFNDQALYTKLNRRHRKRILRLLKKIQKNSSRYLFAIDDTLISHWGKNIWGAYRWSNHGKHTLWGHKLLVIGVVDTHRKVFIPVFWEILHREGLSEKEIHEKNWEVALRLLDDTVSSGFPRLPLVADSGFSGNKFIHTLMDKGYIFVLEIQGKRKVLSHGNKALDEPVFCFFSNRFRHKIRYLNRQKWAVSATLKLKGIAKKLKVVAVANKKGLANECFSYYISNRLTWDPTKIWGIARDRWTIEVHFRDLKQSFTLGKAAVRSKQGVETSISISMIALTVIRLEQLSRVNARENQYRRPPPASSIVQHHQLLSLKSGILKLSSINETSVRQKFKNRLHPKNFGQKPVLTRAEKYSMA
jgi:hypothetical protein